MKVLVPLDGSEATQEAMAKGLTLLKEASPKVTLLCVRAKGFDDTDDDRREIFEEDPDDEIFASNKEAQAMLDQALADCEGIGVQATSKIIVGNFAKVILDEADGYDLLIMHHLGKEPFKEKLRMSKSESLVRSLDCPVFLV